MKQNCSVFSPEITESFTEKWCRTLDVTADIFGVSAAVFFREDNGQIRVCLTSLSDENPYKEGKIFKKGEGLFAEEVFKKGEFITVDGSCCKKEKKLGKPDGEICMVSFAGIPVFCPTGEIFGVLAIMDNRPLSFTKKQKKMLEQMKQLIEKDLELLEEKKDKNEMREKLLEANKILVAKKHELEKARGILEDLSKTDGLTGLMNRKGIIEEIDKEIIRGSRYPRPFSVAMISIDGFRNYTDVFGSEIGNLILREIAAVMKKVFRVQDEEALWEEDVFLVFFPETDLQGARNAVDKFLANFKIHKMKFRNEDIELTLTVGMTEYDGLEEQEELLNRLEKSMLKGRIQGGNTVVAEV